MYILFKEITPYCTLSTSFTLGVVILSFWDAWFLRPSLGSRGHHGRTKMMTHRSFNLIKASFYLENVYFSKMDMNICRFFPTAQLKL